ncbi:DUF2971 domain-containing protein [Nocardioides sp. JQ2195]|uniref:DUF2971 domain-containing protein n=1 Tax=Nocardioides sp. JQ2195 TaxID=2592334 RepID=UPI00143E98D6|nr:DUF2971 domain-containing protein [Nocardioides sp. JQ2195]QIX27063.1 DUF2971 domain-containing protein [Nocardioides sp. JQ2195]
MSTDYTAYFEEELRNSPKRQTDDLYHYTSSDAAILGILATQTIRLSPFHSTNDLWESKPLYPNLQGSAEFSPEATMELWEEIDRYIRMHSKVACFTNDWDLPEAVLDRDALRGWSHLSLWAHYGQRHAGVCLRFDRQKLLSAFEAAKRSAVHQFSGDVRYRTVSLGAGPEGIDLLQVQEFGADAAAFRYSETHHHELFFSKHMDWSNESEFRLVRTDLSPSPFYLDIADALNGVFLGDEFPKERIPALQAVLGPVASVPIFQLRFHSRRLWCDPFELGSTSNADAVAEPVSSFGARREGTLAARLEELRAAEREADGALTVAREAAQPVAAVLAEGVDSAAAEVVEWPATLARVHSSITAIPEGQRRRAPGTGGETPAYETGLMIVAEHKPQYSFTFVAAVALQVFGKRVRMHATISVETWLATGNVREELWREVEEADVATAPALARLLLDRLREALGESPGVVGFEVHRRGCVT